MLCKKQVCVSNQALGRSATPCCPAWPLAAWPLLKADVLLLKAHLSKTVAADPDLAERDCRPRRVPSVGLVLSWTLMSHLPKLSRLSGRQIDAFVAVAPFDRQSGTQKFKSTVGGGRVMVRNVTCMAALAGASHNPALAATKQRLGKGGRPLEVVLVALIR